MLTQAETARREGDHNKQSWNATNEDKSFTSASSGGKGKGRANPEAHLTLVFWPQIARGPQIRMTRKMIGTTTSSEFSDCWHSYQSSPRTSLR